MRFLRTTLCCGLIAVSALAENSFESLRHTQMFQSIGADSTLTLPQSFLIPGSETIFSADSSVTFDPSQYKVDYRNGLIHFNMIPDSARTWMIVYRALPVRLKSEYKHWEEADSLPSSAPLAEKNVIRKTAPETEAFQESDLQRSGSLFRGISVGTNQGMRLQSGLRLQLSGKIAPNVEVLASLTDQNTPIQPEGNTQTLQEIDKVFIQVKSPRFLVDMGDIVYQTEGGEFSTYSRKLQGGMGTTLWDNGSVTLVAAGSKGDFTTNHIEGQESNQGPYQLSGKNGEEDIIVLAGTERVWVDGVSMTRGEDNDYVIEYGLGQITFTRNKLITGDSRITVDFEYSSQNYSKTVYGAKSDTRLLNNKLSIQTTFLRESDDRENPLDFVLTDAYKAELKSVGDSSEVSHISGASYVGAGEGSYILRDSLSDAPYYEYAGEGLGDYNVRFSHVGYGNGDYSFQGYGVYQYEGPDKGTYLPIVVLPAPTTHQTASVYSAYQFSRYFSIDGEMGLSDQDLNTFSNKDDGDNKGTAWQSSFTMKEKPVGLGILSLKGNLRQIDDQYRTAGRSTEVEHGRKWGVSEGQIWGESSRELEAEYHPVSSLTLKSDLGRFRREDFESDRRMVAGDFKARNLPTMSYQSEWINTVQDEEDGYWLRQSGQAGYSIWKFKPGIRYQNEHRKTAVGDSIGSGFRYDEVAGQMGFTLKQFDFYYERTVRDDKTYEENELDPYSIAKTDQIKLNFKTENGLSYAFMFTHRNRDYSDISLSDQKSDLADMTVNYQPSKRVLSGSVQYKYSSTALSEMVRDTVQVGAGYGDYRYNEELDELVPDADGDLLIRMVPTGAYLPVNDMKTSLEWVMDFSRLGPSKKDWETFLRNWRTRSRIRVERRDTQRDFGKVNAHAFKPRWGEDSTLVTGVFSIQNDFEYTPKGGRFYGLLRLRNDDSENHQIAGEGLVRHVKENEIRLKGNPHRKWGLLFEYQYKTEEKIYETRPSSNRDIHANEWTAESSFRPKQTLEIALKTIMKKAEDRSPSPISEATSLFFMPRVELSFLSRGRFQTEFEWGNVKAKPETRTLPYELLGGDQAGRTIRWTVLMTYRITGHVQGTLTYRGRKEPWRDQVYQTGQVEVRAFF